MYIYVVGVPGSGKTSVIKKALDGIDKQIYVVNFGDYLLKIVKEKYNIQHRDEIRKKLRRDDYIRVQLETAKAIDQQFRDKDLVIIDTHLLIKTNFGYYSGTPEWISDILRPSALVIVVAPPYQIYNRRIKDKTRLRDLEPPELIELQQELTIFHAISLMFKYNCYLKIIENKDGELERAGKELCEYLKGLLQQFSRKQ